MRANVKFFKNRGKMSEAIIKFTKFIHPCVTHLKIEFEETHGFENASIFIEDFLRKLGKRSSKIQVLIFKRIKLLAMDESHSAMYLCEKYLPNIRILIFHDCEFEYEFEIYNYDVVTSKIELFDASNCRIADYGGAGKLLYRSLFDGGLGLRKLRFANTNVRDYFFLGTRNQISPLELLDLEGNPVSSDAFRDIREHVSNLSELYVCSTYLEDEDFEFNDTKSVLPRLRVICLRGCRVTYRAINALIKSCPSLQHVYVGKNRFSNRHSFIDEWAVFKFDYSLCKSQIVEVIDQDDFCNHYLAVDYMTK